jgi:hypothetical protein
MTHRHHSHQLWRVDWNHKSGYQAPVKFIEVNLPEHLSKEKARILVIKLAKQQSRLGDFPEKWSCKVSNLSGLWA